LFTKLSVDTVYNYIDNKALKNISVKTKKDLLSSNHPYAKLLLKKTSLMSYKNSLTLNTNLI